MALSALNQRVALGRVRLLTAVISRLEKIEALRPLLGLLPRSRLGRGIMNWLLGFRRPFASLEASADAAGRFFVEAHQTHRNLHDHFRFSQTPRTSDYPVIYFLSRIRGPFRVFDLGDNIGTLFYCYRPYLVDGDPVFWLVADLPATIRAGARLARLRNLADRLRFTAEFEPAEPVDVFLASGSLHYFDLSLPDMIGRRAHRPSHVLVNRTPLTDGPMTHTVQDSGFGLTACTLYNRADLIAGMRALGYELVDHWSIYEMKVEIPLYPERSAPCYRGLYFHLAQH